MAIARRSGWANRVSTPRTIEQQTPAVELALGRCSTWARSRAVTPRCGFLAPEPPPPPAAVGCAVGSFRGAAAGREPGTHGHGPGKLGAGRCSLLPGLPLRASRNDPVAAF